MKLTIRPRLRMIRVTPVDRIASPAGTSRRDRPRGRLNQLLFASLILFGASGLRAPTRAQIPVTMSRYNPGRTGADLGETVLNTTNVNVGHFGKLFSLHVDGAIWGQPLFIPGLAIPGLGLRNVIFLTTGHNSVYAFDADDPNQLAPLWHVNLGPSVPSTVIQTVNIANEVGIVSTPVIDPSTNTLYVAPKTYENGTQVYRLHALDLITGQEKFGGPVKIQGSAAGVGLAAVNGVLSFDASKLLNRPALTLLNGAVYLCFGSHEDFPPYHGWVIRYNASTLKQTAAWCVTPNGGEGAIWMGGQGPLSDAQGNLFFETSNGAFDANTGGSDYSDSFVKLTSGTSLSVADYFTPQNQQALNDADMDLGSGGPILIPGTHLLVGGGKEGVLYLIDTTNMGHFDPSADHCLQSWQAFLALFTSPVYWNGPGGGQLYTWGCNDFLKVYNFLGSRFDTTPAAQGDIGGFYPGGILTLSANGSTPGSGILWATNAVGAGSAEYTNVPGVLRAFDASNVHTELWDSQQNQSRDDVGSFAKFCPPVVDNGKVYVPTSSGALQVYGLLGSESAPPAAPTGLTALGTSPTEINLAWSNSQTSNTGFTIFRRINNGPFSPIAFTAGSARTYQDRSLSQKTTCYYEVTASSGGVSSLPSNEASATTPSASPGPPAPTSASASPGEGSITLSWSPSPGATSYRIYRSVSSGGEGKTPYQVGVAGLSITDAYIASGVTYWYQVTAVNSVGESAASNETHALCTMQAPRILSLDFVGGAAGVPASMGASETAGAVPAANWNSAAGAAGSFALHDNEGAVSGASASWSAAAVGETSIAEYPGNSRMMKGYLKNTSTSTTTVTIAGLSTTYTANGCDVYVYFDGANGSTTASGSYTLGAGVITGIDAGGASFSGTFVQSVNGVSGNYVLFPNVTWNSFTLSAFGAAGAPVNGIQVVSHLVPPPPYDISASAVSATQIDLSWKPRTATQTGFVVWRAKGTGTPSPVAQLGANITTLVDTGLTPGTTYTYQVCATAAAGSSTPSSSASATTQAPPPGPAGPTGVSAVAAGGQIVVQWKALPRTAQGAHPSIISYNIYRATTSGGEGAIPIQSGIAGSSFTDNQVGNGVTYYYEVTSVNLNSESSRSAEVSAYSVTASPRILGVDFVGGGPKGAPSVMGPSEIAGVVPSASWNNAPGATGSLISLLDSSGGVSGATAAWSAPVTGSTSIADTAGNNRMMKGYLNVGGNESVKVTVAGLSATYTANGYDLYVYFDGDNPTSSVTSIYSIGTGLITAVDAAHTNFSGQFFQSVNGTSGNYVLFPNVTWNSFTLSASRTASAPINGIQVVAHLTPPPPFNVAAVVEAGHVVVSWLPRTSSQTGFIVQRSEAGTPFATVALLGGTTTHYIDTTTTPGVTYNYQVFATNPAGISTPSTAASAAVPGN